MSNKIGIIKLDDDTSIEEIQGLIEHITEGKYVVETKWSKGEVIISKQVNATLDEVDEDA